jgi:hypothetical protein
MQLDLKSLSSVLHPNQSTFISNTFDKQQANFRDYSWNYAVSGWIHNLASLFEEKLPSLLQNQKIALLESHHAIATSRASFSLLGRASIACSGGRHDGV